ncbi:hypothetical protein FPV67DRAFT_1443622 [Lyophyllum atratum]|nr:hypothetical protein FPV67DRAFT_1443622 [Lyophyllum atratum]
MQATPSNAIQNNQRLFVPFSRKLASDDQAVYAAFAEKFAVWLSDERAYYEEARPEIAQSTLRRNVGANPDLKSPFHISSCIGHPMVASYSRLLRAVHPYKDRFLESDLQEIKSLLKTITMPVPTRIVSNDLTTEPHPPIPEVTVTPKVTASTSRQRSTPTPAFAPPMRSSLSSNIIESGPGRSAVGLTRSHFNSAATFDGKTISPSPYVTDDSVEMTQYTTDLLAPAAAPVLPRKVAVSRAPSASFGYSKEPERDPSSLFTPAHDGCSNEIFGLHTDWTTYPAAIYLRSHISGRTPSSL